MTLAPRAHRLSAAEHAEMLVLARCGVTVTRLARRYGVTGPAITIALKKQGYSVRRDNDSPGHILTVEHEAELVVMLYYGHSYSELAERYHTNRFTVRDYAMRLGVRIGRRVIMRRWPDGPWQTGRLEREEDVWPTWMR